MNWARAMHIEIDCPPFGMTVLPPWGQAIWQGKNIENRGPMILGEVRGYRGPILLSQSSWKPEHHFESWQKWNKLVTDKLVTTPYSDVESRVRNWAGKVFGVAVLSQILTPLEAHGLPWSEVGKHGLLLADFFEAEPVRCSGGTGFWRVFRCEVCERISAGTWKPGPHHDCKDCVCRSQANRGKLRIKINNAAQMAVLRASYAWKDDDKIP